MKVKVRFLGVLVRYAREGTVEFALPQGATVMELLGEIGRRFGEQFPEDLWSREASLFASQVLMIRDQTTLQNQTIRLHEGDEIIVVRPIGGGALIVGLSAESWL